MALDLKISEDKNKKLKRNLYEVKCDNQKEITQLKSEIEQQSRQIKLMEVTTKSQVLEAQNKFSSDLSIEKAKSEAEKRKILSFAADEFRDFFNPSEVISERAYRNLITKTKESLLKLKDNDAKIRRLVGANHEQNTVDAVAEALVHFH